MATYITDEIVFDLPEGFVDKSLTFLTNGNEAMPVNLVIARDARKGEFEEQANGMLDEIVAQAPDITKVRGVRSREIGN